MKKISKATIAAINSLTPDDLVSHGILQEAKSGVICPFCDNGSGHSGTGVTRIKDTNLFHCFKCNKTFNNLQIFKPHYGVLNFVELVEKICAEFGIAIEYVDFDAPRAAKKTTRHHKEETIDDVTLGFIKKDLETEPDALKKMCEGVGDWRGLTYQTLSHFNCRLIWQWTPPKSRTKPYTPSPRVIVPYSGGVGYLARLIKPPNKLFSKPAQIEFFKDKEKLHAGHKTLFNPDALTSTDPIFCVEGYIDAMSIWQVGYPVVALGGAAEYHLLLDAVKTMPKKPLIIILLDSDSTGRENAPKLLEGLTADCCPACVHYLDDDLSKIDANDILQNQGADALRGILQNLVDEALPELAALQDDFAEKKDKRKNDRDLNSLFAGNDSDLAFARRLEKFCGDDVRFVVDEERWLAYQNGVWKRIGDKNSAVVPLARSLADTMTQYATNINERNLADKFQSTKKISAAVTLFKSLDSIMITADDLDRHPELLCVQNGVVDLQTGWLYPNVEKRSAYLTQQVNATMTKDAKSETVDDFFRDIMPDEMTRAGLLRWLGYCLTGDCREEKFATFIGSGSNGKGVLGSTLLELLGNYATGLSQRALIRNSPFATDACRATTDINVLEKRRLALSEELPQKAELNTELLKSLTGGDRLPIRQLYKEARTIRNYCKINISSNFLPAIENINDQGLKRRLLQFPFTVRFGVDKPIDFDLKRKMLLPENLSALLFLLVREAFAWYRRDDGGLIISAQMKQATADYLNANNFVAEFLDDSEQFLLKPDATVKAKEFVEALKKVYPVETARFKRRDLIDFIASSLPDVEYTHDRKGYCAFRGIDRLADSDFSGKPVDPDYYPI